MRRIGMRRFSMGDVAERARVSRGSVYRYFPDRGALVRAVLARVAERFVARSADAVGRGATLAQQVAEAAVFIRTHLDDEVLTLQLPSHRDTLLATVLTANVEALVANWAAFWFPHLAAAESRGEIRVGLDHREAAEWIVRMLLSVAVMPSVVVDLSDPDAVRRFVERYIVRGLAP